MYKFRYDYIKNKYGNNSILLFSDTKTKDVYEDFSKDTEMFDFSNYSTKSKYYDSNKLVVGKMKDEKVVSLLKICWIKAKDALLFGR